MAESVLHLRLPGLLGPLPADAVALIASDACLERLAAFLSQGRRRPPNRAHAPLPPGFTLPGASPPLPVGPLSLLGDGGDPGDGYWLRADPVQFVPDRDQLRLLGPETLALEPDEANRIVGDFNRFYADDGITLYIGAASRWYLHCTTPPDLETTPLPDVIGDSVEAGLPTGEDAVAWRARLNEIQMFLHGHPVNQEREVRGQPAVNGIWPWGGGVLSQVSSRWARVFSDDPLVVGLARSAGVAVSGWPERPRDALSAGAGNALFAANLPAVDDGETFQTWERALTSFAADWAPALEAAFAAGEYSTIEVDTGAAGLWTIRSRDRWAFWRRSRSLARLLLTQ